MDTRQYGPIICFRLYSFPYATALFSSLYYFFHLHTFPSFLIGSSAYPPVDMYVHPVTNHGWTRIGTTKVLYNNQPTIRSITVPLQPLWDRTLRNMVLARRCLFVTRYHRQSFSRKNIMPIHKKAHDVSGSPAPRGLSDTNSSDTYRDVIPSVLV